MGKNTLRLKSRLECVQRRKWYAEKQGRNRIMKWGCGITAEEDTGVEWAGVTWRIRRAGEDDLEVHIF